MKGELLVEQSFIPGVSAYIILYYVIIRFYSLFYSILLLYYIILYYTDPLSLILGCNHSQVSTHLCVTCSMVKLGGWLKIRLTLY